MRRQEVILPMGEGTAMGPFIQYQMDYPHCRRSAARATSSMARLSEPGVQGQGAFLDLAASCGPGGLPPNFRCVPQVRQYMDHDLPNGHTAGYRPEIQVFLAQVPL